MGDHFVTRRTHTLEVAQIARTIARALTLNEDLAEAIALGHDLGHPPFGHAGEEALDQVLPEGFRHAEQSLRVVERLENGGRGLNLTREVRDGIVHSSKERPDILGGADGPGLPATLEGQIVRLADAVAYINPHTAYALPACVLTAADPPAAGARRRRNPREPAELSALWEGSFTVPEAASAPLRRRRSRQTGCGESAAPPDPGR